MSDEHADSAGSGGIDKGVLTIGAAAALLVAGVTSAVWLNSALLSVGYKIDTLTERLSRLEGSASGEHRWTESDMRRWVAVLKASNPTLVIPSADR